MTQKLVINPVTRISGFMEIQADVENNRVVEVKTEGLMFRGFEKMLTGRSPLDAVYFTQRICGICSSAHSVASSLALEDAMGFVPTEQGKYLRDILHGCEFLQNHIRHFYQYTLPDFVRLPAEFSFLQADHADFRLPKDKNDRLAKDYLASLEISRKAHALLAVLGGKAPHNHGVFIGGITTQATTDKIIAMQSMLHEILRFIEDSMIPDVWTIADYYPDYYCMGGGYGNLLSYGCFDGYKDLGTLYVNPLVYMDNQIRTLQPSVITEKIDYAWYQAMNDSQKPMESLTQEDIKKAGAYSWVKAPRYEELPFETGPLARQWLCGDYRRGISAMDRTIARVLEARKIARILQLLLEQLIPEVSVQQALVIPEEAQGKGLVDTTRGALGHWIKIKDQKISFYQIITPSAWNLSTRDYQGKRGTAEQALMGTFVQSVEKPVALGRIIRSFDPCISCATHVMLGGECVKTIEIVC